MNILGWLPLDWFDLLAVQGTLKNLLQHHSSKASILPSQSSLWSNSHLYLTTGKAIVLTIWMFVGKVMSLLFNMLSRSVIVFLPRSKSLNFRAAVTICSDLGTQENKICHCFHFFPFYFPWSDGTGCRYLSFVMWSFKPDFSLSPFSLLKRLFSSSSLSAIRVVSSAYLRLLLFFPAILIPACDSPSPAFCLMCSAYKLNKQGDNIQPCCIDYSFIFF